MVYWRNKVTRLQSAQRQAHFSDAVLSVLQGAKGALFDSATTSLSTTPFFQSSKHLEGAQWMWVVSLFIYTAPLWPSMCSEGRGELPQYRSPHNLQKWRSHILLITIVATIYWGPLLDWLCRVTQIFIWPCKFIKFTPFLQIRG